MSDIVERLRWIGSRTSWESADQQCNEAADEIERLRAEVEEQRVRLAAVFNLRAWEKEQKELRSENAALRAASELSIGILWMIEDRSGKVRDAHRVLFDALGKDGLKRGITAAIGRGYEAEHPPSADWWAGKKEEA